MDNNLWNENKTSVFNEIINYIKNRYISNKAFRFIANIFLGISIISAVYFLIKKSFRNMLLALFCGLIMGPLVLVVEYLLKIVLPTPLISMILFIMLGGFIWGPAYNFYTIFPNWDTLLHGLSGFMFACLGYILAEKFIGLTDKKSFYIYLTCGIMFSITIAALWEMIEYLGTTLFNCDMQEDMIINSFKTYYFTGNHDTVFNVYDITKTVIYYGSGKELVINGYLDIGLYDTLDDILICVIGNVVFLFSMLISNRKKQVFKDKFIPRI